MCGNICYGIENQIRRKKTNKKINIFIISAQSTHLVNGVIHTRHTACHAPPNDTILRMHCSSESLFPPSVRDWPSEWSGVIWG